MNKKTLLCGLLSFSALAMSNAYEGAETGQLNNANTVLATPTDYLMGSGVGIIYDNGSLINGVGTGVGGVDESILQSNSLLMNTLGFGHQASAGNRVADDFEVTGGSWDIESIDFFAYQTGETASTITGVNLRIWDGVPGDPGSSVVFGDDITNIMTSTQNSNILRVNEPDSGIDSNRQIAVSNVAVGISLSPGTYWLDWQTDGSGASGPWAPPVTINGQTTTGNALQSVDAGVSFAPILDSGTFTSQGLPFVIYGTVPPPAPVPGLGNLGLILLSLLAFFLGRRFLHQ